MGEPFDRDLEGVFEHRAGDFSPELRELLRELWLEGVRHGRELERLEGHELRRRLESLERPAAVITSRASSPSRELRPGELTLEHITRAAAELDARFPRPAPLEPRFGFGRWLEELAGDDRAPWRSSAHISRALEDVRHPGSRRELFGTWEDE